MRSEVAQRLARLAERHQAEQDLAVALTVAFDRITAALADAAAMVDQLTAYGHTQAQIAELVGVDPTLIRYATRTTRKTLTAAAADTDTED